MNLYSIYNISCSLIITSFELDINLTPCCRLENKNEQFYDLLKVNGCLLFVSEVTKVNKTYNPCLKALRGRRHLNISPISGPKARVCVMFHISSVRKYGECEFWNDSCGYSSRKDGEQENRLWWFPGVTVLWKLMALVHLSRCRKCRKLLSQAYVNPRL